jgi:hypothetical protein
MSSEEDQEDEQTSSEEMSENDQEKDENKATNDSNENLIVNDGTGIGNKDERNLESTVNTNGVFFDELINLIFL